MTEYGRLWYRTILFNVAVQVSKFMDIYELHCFYFIWLTSHNWALFILPGYVGDDICQYVPSYPATIGLLLSHPILLLSVRFPLPESWLYVSFLFTIYNKHCIPNRQHDKLQTCVLDSLDHINRSPIDPETIIETF
jgi:hypothetical protein